MIIQLHTHKTTQTEQPKVTRSREIAPSAALHRETPADVLNFQPYKAITQTRIVLRPRSANGAVRGRRVR